MGAFNIRWLFALLTSAMAVWTSAHSGAQPTPEFWLLLGIMWMIVVGA